MAFFGHTTPQDSGSLWPGDGDAVESCDEWGRPTRTSRQTGADTAAGYRSRRNGALLSMMLPARRERRTYDPLRLQLTGIAYERCLDNTVACGTVEAVRAFGFGYGAAGLGNGGGPNNNE